MVVVVTVVVVVQIIGVILVALTEVLSSCTGIKYNSSRYLGVLFFLHHLIQVLCKTVHPVIITRRRWFWLGRDCLNFKRINEKKDKKKKREE